MFIMLSISYTYLFYIIYIYINIFTSILLSHENWLVNRIFTNETYKMFYNDSFILLEEASIKLVQSTYLSILLCC